MFNVRNIFVDWFLNSPNSLVDRCLCLTSVAIATRSGPESVERGSKEPSVVSNRDNSGSDRVRRYQQRTGRLYRDTLGQRGGGTGWSLSKTWWWPDGLIYYALGSRWVRRVGLRNYSDGRVDNRKLILSSGIRAVGGHCSKEWFIILCQSSLYGGHSVVVEIKSITWQPARRREEKVIADIIVDKGHEICIFSACGESDALWESW